MKNYGFLAIWCEIAAQDREDYRNWLTQEHIADRTFLPGLLGVRLFENVANPYAHFILYAADGPEMFDGADYRKVLDNPTPWTRRVMPKFQNFDRALGEQLLKLGNGVGAHIVAWRLKLEHGDFAAEAVQAALAPLVGKEGVASLRVFGLRRNTTDRHNEEKTMRGGVEGDFDLLLCAEMFSEPQARVFEQSFTPQLQEVFGPLARADSSCCRMIYAEAAHEGPTSRI